MTKIHAKGDSKIEYDSDGIIVRVPYFCRKGCNKGWPSKRARSGHERIHTGSMVGRPGKGEPEVGSLEHYHWARRNLEPVSQEDRNAWNAYMREYQKGRKNRG